MAKHYVRKPEIRIDRVESRGISIWQTSSRCRVRSDIRRETPLRSIEDMKRWAKRFSIDISWQIGEWKRLEAELAAQPK